MAKTIGDAITALGIEQYALFGEPTNETEFNASFRKITGADENGHAILSDDTSLFGVTWAQVSAKKTELETNEDIEELRAERNRRLAETDWWVLPDRTATTAQTNYRQALRDITDGATSLDDVTWPTKPS
ncbi:tail assembly chaperone [Methylophilales phage Melnitz-3 EXVC039M]|nr:tail assembly chaperone [Methylophilales phage Melnitz-3 EXVC039M]